MIDEYGHRWILIDPKPEPSPRPVYKPPPPPPPGQIDDWEKTMTPAEVAWCWRQINAEL